MAEDNDLLAEIKALPVIEREELNVIVGFKTQYIPNGGSLHVLHTPEVCWNDEIAVLNTEECALKNSSDIVEILQSEYIELKNKISKKHEQ